MAQKRVTVTKDYNKRRGLSHGSEQFTYIAGNRNQAGRDITDAQQSTYDGASTHAVIGVNLPEKFHSTLIVDGRSIGIKISLLTKMMTFTSGTVLTEPRREDNGKILGGVHVPEKESRLVRDEIYSQVDSISPCDLVHLIIRYFDNPVAQNPAVLSPMNSDSRERMINLVLTQSDLPQRKIQSMYYPTFAR